MNHVIPRCGSLQSLEAGMSPDLRACAPKMWAACEGVLAALDSPAGAAMRGLRFRLLVTRQILASRAGQLLLAGLPGHAPAGHVTVVFEFADLGRTVLVFVQRSARLPKRPPRLARIGDNAINATAACQTCEEQRGLTACPGCRAVWYCSAECQAADYLAHDGVCRAVRLAK